MGTEKKVPFFQKISIYTTEPNSYYKLSVILTATNTIQLNVNAHFFFNNLESITNAKGVNQKYLINICELQSLIYKNKHSELFSC